MLEIFSEFRKKLDDIMIEQLNRRIVLYGYGRTGQFLKWYAEYYHGINVDYIITEDWKGQIPYDLNFYRDSIFEFGFKDIDNCVVWIAVQDTNRAENILIKHGFVKNLNFFNFLEIVYGDDVFTEDDGNTDVFKMKKHGNRDIQFMEWLEYKYDFNVLNAIESTYLSSGGASYRSSNQKDLFPILDSCHVWHQSINPPAIFDFGCGKGSALISFLDYGFENVGGVEYEKPIYDELYNNFVNIGMPPERFPNVELICGDAGNVKNELDRYNWFYFFDPFGSDVFKSVIENIEKSIKRKHRKCYIIYINPHCRDEIIKSGQFKLIKQIITNTRQKVCDLFESVG